MGSLARALGLAAAAVLAAAPALWPTVASAEPETARAARGDAATDPEPETDTDDEDEIEVVRVLGLRTGRFIEAPSAFSTHIDPADYANEGKTLDDLLSEQAGVQVRRFGGAGEPATLSIRGSSAEQVELSVNGIRMNSPLTGGSDVSELCLGMVDGIDIERGGRSAIGGRVDLSSPIATGARSVSAQGSASSFGTWRGSAFVSDTFSPRDEATGGAAVDLALGYCGFKTDGDYDFARPVQDNGDQVVAYDPPVVQRINNHQQKQSGQLGLGLEPGERHRLELRDWVAWQEGGVPGLDSGDGELAGQDPDAHLSHLQNLAHLEWSGVTLGWVGDTASVGLYHRYQHDDFEDPADPGSAVPDDAIDTRIHTGGVRSAQSWERHALGGRHLVALEVDAHRDAVYADDGVDPYDRGRTSVAGDLTLESGYLDELLVVSPGFRAAWSQDFDPAYLPSLGVVVTPLEWLRIKSNGFGSWRVPSFEELYHPDRGYIRGNPDLVPERAWGADGGVDLVFDRVWPLTAVQLSARAFYQKRRHEIVWTQVSPWVVQPVNLGDTRVLGFEGAFTAEWSRWIGVALTYTELDAELESTGRGVPGRAEREGSARLRLGPVERWKLVAEWLYTGEIIASQDGTLSLPARSVFDLAASVDLAAIAPLSPLRLDRAFGALWLVFAVDNVGDVAVRDALFAPQPGRSFTLGLETRW